MAGLPLHPQWVLHILTQHATNLQNHLISEGDNFMLHSPVAFCHAAAGAGLALAGRRAKFRQHQLVRYAPLQLPHRLHPPPRTVSPLELWFPRHEVSVSIMKAESRCLVSKVQHAACCVMGGAHRSQQQGSTSMASPRRRCATASCVVSSSLPLPSACSAARSCCRYALAVAGGGSTKRQLVHVINMKDWTICSLL